MLLSSSAPLVRQSAASVSNLAEAGLLSLPDAPVRVECRGQIVALLPSRLTSRHAEQIQRYPLVRKRDTET
jgi:hypothetical protein